MLRFLLDCNQTAIRWHAHALVHSICRHSTPLQQQDLVAQMWSLWSGLQLYGRKVRLTFLNSISIKKLPLWVSLRFHFFDAEVKSTRFPFTVDCVVWNRRRSLWTCSAT